MPEVLLNHLTELNETFLIVLKAV